MMKQPVTSLDVDVGAALILDSARRAAAVILKRRAALDQAGQYDTPLAVIAGEIHSVPAHALHHMAVIKQLLKTMPVAVGLETEHTSLRDAFNLAVFRAPTPQEMAQLNEKDRVQNGALSLKAVLGFQNYNYADQTKAAKLRFLLRHDVPVQFTDVAKTQDRIDVRDTSSAAALRACGLRKRKSGVGTLSRDGLWARNRHMAGAALEHVRLTGARILFHPCGNTHVMGRPEKRRPFLQSLSMEFKRQNAAMIAMPVRIGARFPAEIYARQNLKNDEWLLIHGLPYIQAIYDPLGRTNITLGDLQSRADEATYLNALLQNMNWETETLTVDDYFKQKQTAQNEIRDVFCSLRPKNLPSAAP